MKPFRLPRPLLSVSRFGDALKAKFQPQYGNVSNSLRRR